MEAVLNADPAVVRALLRKLRGSIPSTDEELHTWMSQFLGVHFPRWAVSGGAATAPFAPIADAFFMRKTGLLSLACRGGMKTLGVGATITAISHFFPGSDIVSVGAIKEQAVRAHGYVTGFLDRHWAQVSPVFEGEAKDADADKGRVFGYPRGPFVRECLTEKTRFTNGSVFQILPGTIRAVSGPHPNIAIFDEVDLVSSWSVFQKWWGMPVSKGRIPPTLLETVKQQHGADRTERPAQRVITSTRETMSGVMDRLINDSSKMGLSVYQWNIFDTMASCKSRFGGCLCKRGGGVIDSNACPMWDAGCGGVAENADGTKLWEDVRDTYMGTDDETWETQFLCGRPSKKGLVFAEFDIVEPYVTTDADYDRNKGAIVLGIDVGYTDPYVVLLGQQTAYSIDIFDMIYATRRQVEDIKYMLTSGEWPYDSSDPDSMIIRDYLEIEDKPYGRMAYNVEDALMDPHYPADRAVWGSNQVYHIGNGSVILPTFNIHKCDAGIKDRLMVLHRRFRTFRGPDGKLMSGIRIHPRCAKLIWELSVGYRYRVDPATQEVSGDTPVDANNHCIDALGYMVFERDRQRSTVRMV